MWHMWDMPIGMGWGWLFGGLWMVIFWGGLIAVSVWGISKLTRRNDSSPKESPLDLAKERYAKGEITRKEFDQLKKDLA